MLNKNEKNTNYILIFSWTTHSFQVFLFLMMIYSRPLWRSVLRRSAILDGIVDFGNRHKHWRESLKKLMEDSEKDEDSEPEKVGTKKQKKIRKKVVHKEPSDEWDNAENRLVKEGPKKM